MWAFEVFAGKRIYKELLAVSSLNLHPYILVFQMFQERVVDLCFCIVCIKMPLHIYLLTAINLRNGYISVTLPTYIVFKSVLNSFRIGYTTSIVLR